MEEETCEEVEKKTKKDERKIEVNKTTFSGICKICCTMAIEYE